MAKVKQKQVAKRVKEQARKAVAPKQPPAHLQGSHPEIEPPEPPPSGGGGGGGGGGQPPDDYGIPGLPADVAAKLDQLNRQYQDHDVFLQKVLAYLHTTPWFQNEYKGIDAGVAKGIFNSGIQALSDYRAYETQVQNSYRSYYGRTATKDELAAYIALGYNPGQVEQTGQGHAYVAANKGDIQYAAGAFAAGQLTDEELKAYGEEQSGLNSELGLRIKNKVESALQKAQRVFAGTVGSSSLGDQSLSSVLQNRRKSDIAA